MSEEKKNCLTCRYRFRCMEASRQYACANWKKHGEEKNDGKKNFYCKSGG